MAVDIVMPRLSDSMEEGTVAKWLVAEGAEVTRGQPLVEIDTDKATMEYEAERDGTLLQILVAEGETAAIGAPIAWIGAPGEELAAMPAVAPAAAEAPAEPAAPHAPRGARVTASPIAKRIAAERGVDLAAVQGTGPGGMITREDVEAAASNEPSAAPAPEPLSRVQQAIARHMDEAAAVPTFAVEVEIDMTAASELRASLDPKPSFNDLVVNACALALREHPRVNAAYSEQGFRQTGDINVGIAVAAEDALLVPVVREAEGKSLQEIRTETRDLAAKARAGKLAPAELDGGTFTVSNLGMHGVRRFEALLNTPQAGILAVGAVELRPAVGTDDGERVVRPLMSATLASAPRILYGAEAAVFLGRVRELLEDPGSL